MVNGLRWSLVLLLWIYIIWRAYTVPITHDEAYSFLLVKTNYINALVGTANTHWLNSIGMKVGSLVSDHPLSLRWFSVVAWLLYGYSAIKISSRFKNYIAGFALLAALTLNPFLLDFFSLARGYGLACAFTLAAIWKAIEALNSNKWQMSDWTLVMLLAALGVFSNYTTLYFFLSLVVAYVFFILFNQQWKLLWKPFNKRWYFIVIGTSVIAIGNLLFIKLYTGDLEYGGHEGFLKSIFGSLIRSSLYLSSNTILIPGITYLVAALVGVCIIYAFIKYIKNKEVTPLIFLSACLWGMLMLSFLFNVLFETPYLYNRTTLVLYPCIVVTLFFFSKEIKLKGPFQKVISISAALSILSLFVFHYYRSFNVTYCYEWKEQADTKKCLDILVARNAQNVLAHRWHSGVLTNYYKVVNREKYSFQHQWFDSAMLPVMLNNNSSSLKPYDYTILLPPYDLQALQDKGLKFTLLNHFPVSNAVVLKLGVSK